MKLIAEHLILSHLSFDTPKGQGTLVERNKLPVLSVLRATKNLPCGTECHASENKKQAYPCGLLGLYCRKLQYIV